MTRIYGSDIFKHLVQVLIFLRGIFHMVDLEDLQRVSFYFIDFSFKFKKRKKML